jgi:hypothetical protein
MFQYVFRLATTIDLSLVVVQATGCFPHALPLAGSGASQLGIVLGAALAVYETGEVLKLAIQHLTRWWRK